MMADIDVVMSTTDSRIVRLTKQIDELKNELRLQLNANNYLMSRIDELVKTPTEERLIEMEKDYINQIEELENKVSKLKNKLQDVYNILEIQDEAE